RLIELPAGAEPLEHRFRSRSDIDNRAILNAEGTHVDALRLISRDQGGYYHPLDAAQAVAANRHGWKMMFEVAVEEGDAYAMVDFADSPTRFAAALIANPGGRDTVRLVT